MRPGLATLRRRLQGVGFIVVIFSLIGLSIAKYNGVFEDSVPVSLRVDDTGPQLQQRSDVKVRGLIVGEVGELRTTRDTAFVELELEPAMVDKIPSNVRARVLPKTLFGERYVELVIPDDPSQEHISAGAVISRDRSASARELGRALDGLLPVLQAVQPADLATTLSAVAGALEGRGDQLGDNLVLAQRFLREFNTEIPNLRADISGLADLAETYSEAAPDLVEALESLSTTSRTVVEQRQNLQTLFASVTAASRDATAFLEAHKENLISLAASSRPTLESLARYSPEFPCFFDQLAGLVPRIDSALGVDSDEPGVHITLEVVNHRGKYVPGQDEPRYNDDRGPRCYPIAPPNVKYPQYPPDGGFQDGAADPPAGDNTAESLGYGDSDELTPGGSAQTTPQRAGVAAGSMGLPNSPAEQRFVAELLALSSGRKPSEIPGWSTVLVGPLLRGAEVALQ